MRFTYLFATAIAVATVVGCSQQHSEESSVGATLAAPPLNETQRADARQFAEASELSAARAKQDLGLGFSPAPVPTAAQVVSPLDSEHYAEFTSHGVESTTLNPVSTFAIDVDTASYANVRRLLQQGQLPRSDAVRVEELINYFSYADPAASGDAPFAANLQMAPTPWNAHTQLLRIALKAPALSSAALPPSNLVFLLDVSGSMNSPDKLPLLQRSLRLLTQQLRAEDRVSIVVYAGAAGVVLEPTAGDQQLTIEQAVQKLQAGGSTHGSAGIMLAYAKARETYIAGGINRVILATDGDFNVGTVNQNALLDLVERERRDGIALSVLGFGRGNLNDSLMEQLADHGNGNYAYIDTLFEARKVLVEQIGGTLNTVAKDVKIQVEFNPARVSEYRLIGYENRALRREDFTNDAVDGGELGAGHSVVALYELSLRGAAGERLEPLRYAPTVLPPEVGNAAEYAYVKLRYKAPEASDSQQMSFVVDERARVAELDKSSDDFRFSAAVAAFAQRLRGSTYLGNFSYRDMLELADAARGRDAAGYRADFLRVVGLAESLDRTPTARAEQGVDGRNG